MSKSLNRAKAGRMYDILQPASSFWRDVTEWKLPTRMPTASTVTSNVRSEVDQRLRGRGRRRRELSMSYIPADPILRVDADDSEAFSVLDEAASHRVLRVSLAEGVELAPAGLPSDMDLPSDAAGLWRASVTRPFRPATIESAPSGPLLASMASSSSSDASDGRLRIYVHFLGDDRRPASDDAESNGRLGQVLCSFSTCAINTYGQ